MVKKLINIILILVLSFTILPVKQVGNALFNNQWTEETNDHNEHHDIKIIKWAYLTNANLLPDPGASHLASKACYSNFIQQLPVNISAEIHSPPPNFI